MSPSICSRWTARTSSTVRTRSVALLLERFRPGARIVPRHQVGDGEVLLQVTADQGLEIAKRLGSLYVPGKRSPNWRKVKHRPRQEVVVGGFTAGGGNCTGRFGALLVGVYEGGRLWFGGGVGSGFDQKMLDALTAARALATLTARSSFRRRRTRRHVGASRARVEIAFAEWTSEGFVRQASFPAYATTSGPKRSCGRPEPIVRHTSGAGVAEAASRSSPESWLTSTSSASSTCCRTSCAMRSLRRTRYSCSGSVLSRMTDLPR